MIVLGQKQKTFADFRDLTKNFSLLKNLMSSVQGQDVDECIINEILPIWKQQEIIQKKLIKVSRCGCLLAKWIFLVVDINLKNEMICSSRKREPELEKKIRESKDNCIGFERHLDELRRNLSDKVNGSEGNPEYPIEEFTQKFQFLEDIDLTKKELVDENFSFRNLVKFPDFQDQKLYKDNSLKIPEIQYDGPNEDLGCCRLKFFCF